MISLKRQVKLASRNKQADMIFARRSTTQSLALHTSKRRILDTATCISQTGNRPVVGPTSKLLLHCLREHRAINIRVGWRFRREFAVEIGSVQGIGLCFVNTSTNRVSFGPILTTLGLNEGSYLRCRSLRQSMLWKKLCALISDAPLAPSRRSGLRSRS